MKREPIYGVWNLDTHCWVGLAGDDWVWYTGDSRIACAQAIFSAYGLELKGTLWRCMGAEIGPDGRPVFIGEGKETAKCRQLEND